MSKGKTVSLDPKTIMHAADTLRKAETEMRAAWAGKLVVYGHSCGIDVDEKVAAEVIAESSITTEISFMRTLPMLLGKCAERGVK